MANWNANFNELPKAVQDEPADGDPPPEPPLRPSMEDCCQGGCTHCVFDLYDAAMERYRERLSAWQQRHADRPQGT